MGHPHHAACKRNEQQQFERVDREEGSGFHAERRAVDAADAVRDERAGRNMSATNYDRSATVDPLQNAGTVRMSFRWRNFAVVEGDAVVVSDVFDGGFYIGPSQSFVFERGPELASPTSSRPPPHRAPRTRSKTRERHVERRAVVQRPSALRGTAAARNRAER